MMNTRPCLFWLLCCLPLAVFSQPPVSRVKLTAFLLQSSAVVREGGEKLSAPDYEAGDHWFPVTVPTTVLSGLVQNRLYPDPYSGMNNMHIPDASDSFNRQYNLEQYSHLPNEPNPWKKPYWYRTRFAVPAADKGKRFQLVFKGINYRAEVWLNGVRIADSSLMAGMFAEYDLNVSAAIRPGAENGLAVKIFPLDFPGLPSHPQTEALGDFYDNGGPTGDIGKNVTMLSSVGWDWIPEVRDRNMGIWQPVFLKTSGHVVITRPQIITDLPALPDTGTARIRLRLLLNNDGRTAVNGRLQVIIKPENFAGKEIAFTVSGARAGTDTTGLWLDPAVIPALTLAHPKIWWPNGYGEPNLYRIRLRYYSGATLSDDTSFVFGIRTVSTLATTENGWVRRDFLVNGKKIHLNGGAWVPDMMLNRDSLRNDVELRLCRNANINLVRIWGGGVGETDDFYAGADRYGLLVWQDFWITGDTHGGFKGSASWPPQGSVFLSNVLSTVYRIRNHPSLLVWTGGNEGHAREELYTGMRNAVSLLDGTRPFIPCSSGFSKTPAGWKESWPDDKPSGVYSGGPYSWVGEKKYFTLVDSGRDWGFKDETGIPSQPPFNSLAKIIPDLVPDSALPYPLNNSWGYHDACSGNGKYDVYYQAMAARFGQPRNLRDFSMKMQLMNASGYRAIFESAGHRLNQTGGVMLWKLNAAFPSVIWQIYDWYLEPNAGFYFLQNALEPLHIQFNADDSSVSLVNRPYRPAAGLHALVRIFSPEGKLLYRWKGDDGISAATVKKIMSLREPLAKDSGVQFISLQLTNDRNEVVSRNTYWLSSGDRYAEMAAMPVVQVSARVVGESWHARDRSWTIVVSNPGDRLAFFINPQLWNGEGEVMPSLWSANYFTLPPGEQIRVTVTADRVLCGDHPELRWDGWNISGAPVRLTGPPAGK